MAAWNVEYLLQYAGARGLRREALLARFGLEEAALRDIDGRVDLSTYLRMWDELPVLTADPDLPLHVIEHAKDMEAPLSALLFMASPTLGEGLRRLQRWQRVTFDLGASPVTELREEGEATRLIFHHERAPMFTPTAAVVDSCLGIVTIARMATGQVIAPLSADFRHARPKDPSRYHAAFGCRVRFEQPRDTMSFRSSDLSLPHPEASRTLLAIAERHADGVLTNIRGETHPSGDELLGRVREAIVERLPDGGIELSALAGALGMGERTLQRRLRELGTTLRELHDRERKALALHYVQSPHAALTDIAFLLGFSESSAFTRAFIRWTGRSPSEHRRALLAAGSGRSGPD